MPDIPFLGVNAFAKLTAKLGRPVLVDGEILIIRQVRNENTGEGRCEMLVKFEVFDPKLHVLSLQDRRAIERQLGRLITLPIEGGEENVG